jgi:hypothetical protein
MAKRIPPAQYQCLLRANRGAINFLKPAVGRRNNGKNNINGLRLRK